MATQQYFALDSTALGYAAAIADLASKTSTNRGYTVTQVLRAASHDSNIKIVCAYVDESDLTGDTADLHSDNYTPGGTELCRLRWKSLNEFRRSGFHRLGESVRSFEGVGSRPGIHVGRVGNGAADGSTLYDRIAFTSVTSFAAGSSYFFHGIFWQSRTGMSNNTAAVSCETGGAATAAGSINFYCDQDLTPGLFIDGQETYTGSRFDADLPWTLLTNLVGANCWVKGNMIDPSQSNVLLGGSVLFDTGACNPLNSGTYITDNGQLDRKTTLAEVASTEVTYYRPTGADRFAAPYGAPDAVIQDDGGSFTDLTAAAASAGGADVAMFPATAAVNDALYVGHDELWNISMFDISTAGVGTYVLAKEYWNGAAWTAIPQHTFDGGGGGEYWKGTFGNGGTNYPHPFTVFNPPDDWAKTTVNSQGPFYYIRFRYASGTMTTSPVADQGYVGACFHVVHLKDDADPNDAPIIPDGAGMQINHRLSSRVGQVQFINFNTLRSSRFVQMNGTGVSPTIVRALGGRWMEGTTMYQRGELDEWKLGAEEDRDPPWDTSDRPTYADHAGIQRIVDKWGADASEFSAEKVAKWLHLCRWTVGPHPTNTVTAGDVDGTPKWWPMDGVLMDDIGSDHKGVDRDSNPDKHSWAIRGGFNPTTPSTHRRVVSRRGHAHFYAYATANNNGQSPISDLVQTVKLTLQDCVIDGVGSHLDNDAGIFGMRFGGGPGSSTLQDSGQGLREITVQRCAIMNIVTVVADDSDAFSWAWNQKPTIDGLSVIGCSRGVCGGQGEAATVLYVVTEDNGTSFTDQTANNYNGTTYNVFPATPAVNDAIYFGFSRWTFRTAIPNIVTPGVGSGLTGVWEYATAEDTWTAIPTTGTFSDGTSSFTAAAGDRTLVFDRPATSSWVKTDKNGSLIYEVYWIRFRITAGTYTTVPQITSVNGPTGGGYLVSTEADKMEFRDMEGPWLGVKGLNSGYSTDGRTFIVDRVTGRLKSGETIATFEMFFSAAAGTDARYTLAQIKGGSLDKSYTTTEVHEDNDGLLMANVSETPDVDIEEVA